jgi:lipopolysaccharide export system permease protein
MIYRRTLIREQTTIAIGLFLILLGILFTQLVLRLLASAVGGNVAPEGILALLGFNAVFYLNILLSITVFLTVLLTLSRWYRDSEMVVWFASGQPLTATLKPILIFAAPFFVGIVVLSLFLSPWAEHRKIEYQRQLSQRDQISLIAPGMFQEFARMHPPLVTYIESIDVLNKSVNNVFLRSLGKNGNAQVTVARTGHLEERENGERFIVLEQGRRYDGTPGQRDFSVVEFDRLALQVKPAEADAVTLTRRAIPTMALLLLSAPGERAELFWRLSVPIQALVLVLLAIPLAYVNPRIGRFANVAAAAFLYMLYSNSLNIVQSMIAQGKLDFWAGLALPHVVALLLVYVLFRHQMSVTGLLGRLRARPAS